MLAFYLLQRRDIGYLIHTKIHQNPSSSSQEVENVNSLRDDKQTMCDHNRSLEPSSPMP